MRILFGIILFVSFIFADNVAIIKSVTGKVFAKRDERSVALKAGDELQKGDIIITKKGSSIGVIFQDGTLLSLGENSILSVDKYIFKPSDNRFAFDLKLKKGLATFESGKIGKLSPESVNFRVPEGTIGIRGTKFYVEVK